VGNKSKLLQAEKNYGMPSVENLYKQNTFTPRLEIQTPTDAYKWFADTTGAKDVMIQKDITGVNIQVDKELIRHAIEDHPKENRFEFVGNVLDVLKAPDEVWSNRTDNSLERYYIKYYADFPIVVYVNEEDGMRAYTMFEAQRKGKLNGTAIKNLRRGILIYRK
jgi:hypothetical protein